jgi:hypothetical protein
MSCDQALATMLDEGVLLWEIVGEGVALYDATMGDGVLLAETVGDGVAVVDGD